jgi:hypothetical protein
LWHPIKFLTNAFGQCEFDPLTVLPALSGTKERNLLQHARGKLREGPCSALEEIRRFLVAPRPRIDTPQEFVSNMGESRGSERGTIAASGFEIE